MRLKMAGMEQNKQKMLCFHCDPTRRESIFDRRYTNESENKNANMGKQILEYYTKTDWILMNKMK